MMPLKVLVGVAEGTIVSIKKMAKPLHPISKPADTALHSLQQVIRSFFCGNVNFFLLLSWLEVLFVWYEPQTGSHRWRGPRGRTLLVSRPQKMLGLTELWAFGAMSGWYIGTSILGILFPIEMHRLMLATPKIRLIKPQGRKLHKVIQKRK